MIVKSTESKKREFKGIDFELLANGKKLMITRMNYKTGDKAPFHNHPNEQAGYVISGKIRIRFAGHDRVLTAGDSYVIPGNTNHSIEVIEAGEVIDVFTPPREDYM
ncbi:MAG: cupin domain-containing protein [Chlorobi bacterium]|nr:cupin domain-containing protein [Chlorobiota bacterium]